MLQPSADSDRVLIARERTFLSCVMRAALCSAPPCDSTAFLYTYCLSPHIPPYSTHSALLHTCRSCRYTPAGITFGTPRDGWLMLCFWVFLWVHGGAGICREAHPHAQGLGLRQRSQRSLSALATMHGSWTVVWSARGELHDSGPHHAVPVRA